MIRVRVALALARRQEVVELELPAGSTLQAALDASGLGERFPEARIDRARVGIWSRPAARSAVLSDGDRVEIYRPLAADPKEQRRRRARVKPSPGSRNAP